ncbi:MAG TPA: hydrolase TatD [Gammaproteobacteria bacterium]|nr:hydrolase TatD [Gammaproteobacteria bacterium]
MLIDIGANLTHDSFDDDRDDVLNRAVDAGVSRLIVTGATLEGSAQAADLASRHPHLFATAGIHPHHAEETTPEALAQITEFAGHPDVKAIGETGLDFFRNFSEKDDQVTSFEAHIEIAIATGLPMFLHERDAHPTFAEVLQPYRDQISNVVVHCFTGEREALHAYLDLDCHIGITGWICDERRGTHLIPLVKDIPLSRLMIETDAPYLLPRNIKPKPKSRRNEPHYLTVVCQAVADAAGLDFETLAEQTTRNAEVFFGLPTPP